MTGHSSPSRILIVTGMSGAGKTTALHTLEDMGWETADNFPFGLIDRLIGEPPGEGGAATARPLALGIDSRTRGFDAMAMIRGIERLGHIQEIETLFLDCADGELERRFAETRRRHPLAPDRAAADGIDRDRALLAPLIAWSGHLVDTTGMTAKALEALVRQRFAGAGVETTVVVTSFGYSRGLPRNADLVFDMRFLRNPHWDATLRPKTGLDAGVSAYVSADPAHDEAMERIEALLLLLLPRYRSEGKPYVVIGFGCTGGRHRSVHVAELIGARLRDAGFSPNIVHRDLPDETGAGRSPVRHP